MARFESVPSFSHPDAADDKPTHDDREAADGGGGSDEEDDAGFEFAFASPLVTAAGREDVLAPADYLFAHGRILPAYPVFARRVSVVRGTGNDRGAAGQDDDDDLAASASTAPPSPDTYCAWAPRSAPGSPARDFAKSASTGEARRFWRLRDLVGGRSHSDGKEKFVFLQPGKTAGTGKATSSKIDRSAEKPSAPLQHKKQGKKKKSKGAVTEMDMATAHRLFYGKQDPGAAGDRTKKQSFLPYRTGIFGFFAPAHALGRSHHPY